MRSNYQADRGGLGPGAPAADERLQAPLRLLGIPPRPPRDQAGFRAITSAPVLGTPGSPLSPDKNVQVPTKAHCPSSPCAGRTGRGFPGLARGQPARRPGRRRELPGSAGLWNASPSRQQGLPVRLFLKTKQTSKPVSTTRASPVPSPGTRGSEEPGRGDGDAKGPMDKEGGRWPPRLVHWVTVARPRPEGRQRGLAQTERVGTGLRTPAAECNAARLRRDREEPPRSWLGNVQCWARRPGPGVGLGERL